MCESFHRTMTQAGTVSCLFFITLASCAFCQPPSTKPNIVFVLVDDWGFAEAGFRNPAVKTPNFDMLAKTGLILNRHYVFKYCSPSRASLLSGRWPHHAHQWNPDPPNVTVGLNLKFTTLPAKLKQAGYSTHIVGKWHEGFYDPAFLPINRGFDTSSGFLTGAEDHFTQYRDCAVDYWKNKDVDTRNGTYDAYHYITDLTKVFDSLIPSTPLFLYLPLHNIHSPIEAPKEWIDLYAANSTCANRRTIQAMVSVADNVTGHVVKLLKKNHMWENTLMVVSADNGGCGSSNYPLKGSKMNFFEGGVRTIAFANGGFLPKNAVGKTSDGFIHIADWYPTICKLVGVDPSDSGEGKFPVDGLDVWSIITGKNTTTLHDEIVIGYNFKFDYMNKNASPSGAIISGKYKLIVGPQGSGCHGVQWSPLDAPCKKGDLGEDCDPYCLYNIVDDPEERKELSKTEPKILKEMLERYNKFEKEPREMQDQGYHSITELPQDTSVCQYLSDHGSYWRPWKNVD